MFEEFFGQVIVSDVTQKKKDFTDGLNSAHEANGSGHADHMPLLTDLVWDHCDFTSRPDVSLNMLVHADPQHKVVDSLVVFFNPTRSTYALQVHPFAFE